jgi:hypothetical protein
LIPGDHFTSALSRSLSPENAQHFDHFSMYILTGLGLAVNPESMMTEAHVISHFAKGLFVVRAGVAAFSLTRTPVMRAKLAKAARASSVESCAAIAAEQAFSALR